MSPVRPAEVVTPISGRGDVARGGGIEPYAKPGTPNAGSPQVRLALLQQLVALDRATVLPAEPSKLAAALTGSSEVRAAGELTAQEQAQGFRLNRVSVQLAGNSHFGGWRAVVADDTQIVVAQGSAYKGHTVKIGWESWPNATIIYLKKKAGLCQTTFLDLMGKPGEDVRLLAVRVAPSASFAVQTGAGGGAVVEVKTSGGNSVGGDSHWRDVKVKISDHQGVNSAPSLERFNHYQVDGYRGHKTGANAELSKYVLDASGNLIPDGRGDYKSESCTLNANGFLGGDADPRYAAGVVTPM